MSNDLMLSVLPMLLFIIFLTWYMKKASGGKNIIQQVGRQQEHMDKLEAELKQVNETLSRIEKILRDK